MTFAAKVLVTGGAGFIGSNLVPLLLEDGHSVTVLDNFSVGTRGVLQGMDVAIETGDILDREFVSRAVVGYDAVVHLAAQTGVPDSLKDPMFDFQTNVVGTLNLLEACRASSSPVRFVLASSMAPLGRQTPPAVEDKAPLPVSPYGASKLAGEGYCLAYHGSWGVPTVVLRFANVYGPGSDRKTSVVAKFIQDMEAEGAITIDGDGGQTRDFIYVKDLCRAILKALETEHVGDVFHIATGTETSILELATMFQEIVGDSLEIRRAPSRKGDVRRNYASIERAKKSLDWEPLVGLRQGLKETYDWYVSRRATKRA